jgi:hypothetical protein
LIFYCPALYAMAAPILDTFLSKPPARWPTTKAELLLEIAQLLL